MAVANARNVSPQTLALLRREALDAGLPRAAREAERARERHERSVELTATEVRTLQDRPGLSPSVHELIRRMHADVLRAELYEAERQARLDEVKARRTGRLA